MATRRLSRSALAGGTSHEGFLRHRNFRWMKIAGALCLTSIVAYMLIDQKPHPNGGTAYGYTLGTIGALLILWLTLLGLRKRAMTPGRWSLKAWVSAHVYLGLSLIVIATLHTGFHFGLNVHTLAYGLMMLVIASGAVGVWAYVTLPNALSDNRGETTRKQMLAQIEAIDEQIHEAAQPLPRDLAAIVRLSLEHTDIGGGFWRRLFERYDDCANLEALDRVTSAKMVAPEADAIILNKIEELMERKGE